MAVLDLLQLVDELQADTLLSTSQVAARLAVSADQVREWAAEGILPGERVSGRLVFRLAEIARWQLDGLERLGQSPEINVELLG